MIPPGCGFSYLILDDVDGDARQMARPVDGEIRLTPDEVHAILAHDFPDLPTGEIAEVDTGGEHYTVAVGDRLIFRFPRVADAAAKTRREVALLRELAPVVPLTVPRVLHVGQPSDAYPYCYTGQQRVPGVMGEVLRPTRDRWPHLARQFGAFLSALHAFPLERARRLGLDEQAPADPEQLVAETVAYHDLIRHELPEMVTERTAPYLSGTASMPAHAARTRVVSHADLMSFDKQDR